MNPPTVIFRKVEKKLISKIIFLFYLPTLNIICLVEKNNIFLKFYLCIFQSATVKCDCPMQENHEIFKDLNRLLVYFTSFTVCSGDFKKEKEKRL